MHVFGAIAIAAAVAALAAPAAPAAAAELFPQPWVDRSPVRMTSFGTCAVELGAADAVAWYGAVHGGQPRVQAAPVAGPAAAALPPGPEVAAGLGGCPVGAASADGSATLAWAEDVDRAAPIVVAERRPGGQLGAATRLPGAHGREPAVARAASGAAVVGWLEETRLDAEPYLSETRVQPLVAVRDADGAFGAPVALGAPGIASSGEGYGPAIGIDDAGDAVAVWHRPANSERDAPDEAWTARRPAGGAWSAPQRLAAEVLQPPRLAVAPSGEALVVLRTRTGVEVAGGSARDGFGPLSPITGSSAGARSAAPTASSSALAGSAPPTASSSALAGSTAQVVSDDAEVADVVIAPGGAALVALAAERRDSGFARIDVVGRPHGSAPFGAPVTVATAPAARLLIGVDQPRLALAPDGRALLAWRGGREVPAGQFQAPYAALGSAGGGWQRPRPLSGGSRWTYYALPAFGADGSPRVSLLQTAFADGGDYSAPIRPRLRTVAFGPQPAADRTAPRLTLRLPRRQPLPPFNRRTRADQSIRFDARCDEACDLYVRAEVRTRGTDGDGFFPGLFRLAAGQRRVLWLHKVDALWYGDGGPFGYGQTIRVRLTVWADDAAGNSTRATAVTRVTLPRVDFAGQRMRRSDNYSM
ncbi:hypothetical protein Q5424_26250 [Conexibacter sp. JD483]|uniref:hypothetical protein n=1 Tax=unclassified Conexibacter TaxID=2627773 RepID=UPI002716E08B|nr:MULTISPECIES: hypothetical protein [unclassified Conexibacter]MDO8187258.1 hypothetical protein [Conexibacter sp. CPCC 205706]MDO8198867.1 hypothetical protein [Conexibacter sp. CPCC 205762]MDR9372629.1 hypothetical protein [Conexibacter sp. JD483]